MNKQKPFADMEYAQRKRTGLRGKFPDAMDAIIPQAAFEETIKPVYPKSGLRDSQLKGIELMPRMYLPRVWFNLADESFEKNIYGSYAMRKFMRPDYFKEDVPDAATLSRFRPLLEEHDLRKELFRTLNGVPEKNGKITRGGTIADAAIIEAPSPEMKSTQKGNQRHFGMKAHIGADAGTGMASGVEATSANVHDLEVATKLICPDDDFVNGDAGYVGKKNGRK
jgi:IS5 family transposase